MAVIISDEKQIMNSMLHEFVCTYEIAPDEKSFYVAFGYSLLTQICRVSIEDRKKTIGKLKQYLRDGATLQTNGALLEQAMSLDNVFDQLGTMPSENITNVKNYLRSIPGEISLAFQQILAAIFKASNKDPEAISIIQGKLVIPENKYYFTNLSSSLFVRIFLIRVDGETQEYVPPDRNRCININLYASCIKTHSFSILYHSKEKTFDQYFSPDLVRNLPIMFDPSSPNAMVPQPIQLSQQFPGLDMNNVHIPNNPNQFIPKVPSNKQSTNFDLEKSEEFLVTKLFEIFTQNSLVLQKSDADTIKKIMKKIKKQNQEIFGESFENFYDYLKDHYCKPGHHYNDFVIFNSCGKRHCKNCMVLSKNGQVVCDCKKILDDADVNYHLKNVRIKY